jgi:hypothetical protein
VNVKSSYALLAMQIKGKSGVSAALNVKTPSLQRPNAAQAV